MKLCINDVIVFNRLGAIKLLNINNMRNFLSYIFNQINSTNE